MVYDLDREIQEKLKEKKCDIFAAFLNGLPLLELRLKLITQFQRNLYYEYINALKEYVYTKRAYARFSRKGEWDSIYKKDACRASPLYFRYFNASMKKNQCRGALINEGLPYKFLHFHSWENPNEIDFIKKLNEINI